MPEGQPKALRVAQAAIDAYNKAQTEHTFKGHPHHARKVCGLYEAANVIQEAYGRAE